MKFAVIIPAAGVGVRSGSEIPKQYVKLLDRPLLAHSIAAFTALDDCLEVVVAIDPIWRAVAEACSDGQGRVTFVEGGSERQHSIAAALDHLDDTADIVLVHDAARPCVTANVIERVVAAAARHGAAIPGTPIAETVKQIDADGRIVETIPRATLRTAQTPQGFRRGLLLAAYAHAGQHGILGTDDASLVEAYGAEVRVVEGDRENIKITMPEDFQRGEEILKRRSPDDQ